MPAAIRTSCIASSVISSSPRNCMSTIVGRSSTVITTTFPSLSITTSLKNLVLNNVFIIFGASAVLNESPISIGR